MEGMSPMFYFVFTTHHFRNFFILSVSPKSKGCVLVAFPKGEGRDGASPPLYAANASSIFSVSELKSLFVSSFLLINRTVNTITPVTKTPPPRYKNAVE